MASVPADRANTDDVVTVSQDSDTVTYDSNDQWSPAALERAGSSLKALNRMAKRPPINIKFENVGMCVSKDGRQILHDVSGEFRSGELACIIGPSGAGKSTLLNILTGYIQQNISGRITINGHDRNMRVFKKLSSYIMQDDLLQHWLTVMEYMNMAADLKLGKELGKSEKKLIVAEILRTLGLWEHRRTMVQCLSGGQLKRLSIALELVNNPPVIFLDEPTTGLDIVSVRQLVVLLRLLCSQGRTIICTIHQPSASLFSLFDQVYVIAEGRCCYQGTSSFVVPFLSEAGYVCPKTHNPADFVLETLMGNTSAVSKLSLQCRNGKQSLDQNLTSANKRRPNNLHSDMSTQRIFASHVKKEEIQRMVFPTTFMTQFIILIKRLLLQSRRDSLRLWIQLLHHILSGAIIGSIFLGIGNDAKTPIVNVKFCLCVQVFLMFTHAMIPILLFPMEIKILRREYFNQWYSIKAYYAAKTVSTLPTTIIFGMIFIATSYIMAGQPLEWGRFILFTCCALSTALCSEGIGLLFGSTFRATNGAILGPSILAPFLAIACYGFGFGQNIEPVMRFLMGTTFVRFTLSGLCIALFLNRDRMQCSNDLCIYTDPKMFLRDLGMDKDIYWQQVAGVLFYTVLFRIIGFIALKFRMLTEIDNVIFKYLSGMLKR